MAQTESDGVPRVKVRGHGGAVLEGNGKVDRHDIARAGDGRTQGVGGGRKGAARGGEDRGEGKAAKKGKGRGREEEEKDRSPGQEEGGGRA